MPELAAQAGWLSMLPAPGFQEGNPVPRRAMAHSGYRAAFFPGYPGHSAVIQTFTQHAVSSPPQLLRLVSARGHGNCLH